MEVVVWFTDVRREVCAPCIRIGGEAELFKGKVYRQLKGRRRRGSTFSERKLEGVLGGD